MKKIKNGSQGSDVKTLQILLTAYYLGKDALAITGIADEPTIAKIRQFQSENALEADGICGPNTWTVLQELSANLPKFIVSVHGGHGGYNPYTKAYDTLPSTGKRYQHPHLGVVDGHSTDGWFYEGIENRIIANRVADQLRANGIFALVTHHPYKCDYGHLGVHRDQTRPYIEAGYKGYTHAFHSNAIGETDKQKMEGTQGAYVFTTVGSTFSDVVSAIHLNNWKAVFTAMITGAPGWVRLVDKKENATANSDAEANFQVINDIEKIATDYFGAILEEFGFMTSSKDIRLITSELFRNLRVEAAVKTALAVKTLLATK